MWVHLCFNLSHKNRKVAVIAGGGFGSSFGAGQGQVVGGYGGGSSNGGSYSGTFVSGPNGITAVPAKTPLTGGSGGT